MGPRINNFLQVGVFLLMLLVSLLSHAQVDTEFWFVAPEVSKGHADQPVYIRITGIKDAYVTVEMPADGRTLLNNKFIKAGEQFSLLVPNEANGEPITENKPAGQRNKKGILITSTDEVTAYYEVANKNNPDKFTLKGDNALGTDFVIPSQTKYRNRVWHWDFKPMIPRPTEKIDIVATEDNTKVTITLTEDDENGHLKGVPFDITLNRGETYMVEKDVKVSFDDFKNNNDTHLVGISFAGSTVTSDKPIAVTISDDSINVPGGPDQAYDLIGDQLAPTTVLGTQYVAVNTQLHQADISEVYVTVTQDNTIITIDGVNASGGPFKRGDQIVVPVKNGATYIESDKPVVAYQVVGTTASGQGKFHNEFGSGILPPLSGCTGSKAVSFQRLYGGTRFYIQLLTKGKDRGAFKLTQLKDGGIDQTSLLNGLITWEIVPGTGTGDDAWYVANVNLSSSDIVTTHPYVIENTKGLFHLGILEENGSSMSYGYFSSFSNLELAGETQQCEGKSIELSAIGNSIIEKYEWRFGDPTDPANDVTAVIGTGIKHNATKSGTYYLDGIAYGGCKLTEEIEVEFIVPEVNLGPDLLICPDTVITFDVTSGYLSYTWTGATQDATYPHMATYIPKAGVKEVVSLTVIGDIKGCETTKTVEIEAYKDADIDLQVNTGAQVCLNDTIRNYDHDASYSYVWKINGTVPVDQRSDQPFIVAKETGSYTVEVSTPQNCRSVSTISELNVYDLKVAASILKPIECPDNTELVTSNVSVVGTGATAGTGLVYTWWHTDGTNLQNNAATLLLDEPAEVYVEIKDVNGCSDISDPITYEWYPEYKLPNDIAEFCSGAEPVKLSVQSGLDNYKWVFKGVVASVTDTYLAGHPADPTLDDGTYTVSANDPVNGCPVSATVEVTVTKVPTVDLKGFYEICNGEELALEADPGFNNYGWYLQGGTIPISSSPTITITQTGAYVFTGSLIAGNCTNTQVFNVEVLPMPTVDLGTTAQYCKGAGVVLENISPSSLPGEFYRWNNLSIEPKITVNTPGNYWLEVSKQSPTSSMVCSARASVSVSQFPEPPSVDLQTSVTQCDMKDYNLENLLYAPLPPSVNDFWWYVVDESTSNKTLFSSANVHPNTSQGGLYRMIVEDLNGCTDSAESYINALKSPEIDLGGDRVMCENAEIVISAKPGYEDYVWSGGISGGNDTIRIVNVSGTYSVSISNNNGVCTASDAIQVTVIPTPVVSISNAEVCAGVEVELLTSIANPVGNYTYLWSTGDKSLSIFVNKGKEYSVFVTDENGCISERAVGTPVFHPVPQTELPASIAPLCPGVSTRIEPTVTNGSWSYDWGENYSGITTSYLDVEPETSGEVIELTITDENNCKHVSRTTVSVKSKPYFSPIQDESFCEGFSFTFEADTLTNDEYIYEQFIWKRDNVIIEDATGSTYEVTEPGRYTVEAFTGCHWVDTTVTVVVYNNPVVALDTTIFAQVTLLADLGLQPYLYSMNGGIPQDKNSFSSLENGEYIFRVTDANECFVEDTVALSNIIDISIPPVVTNNGDGFNDTWNIKGLEKFPKSEIIIYNRYGKVIHKCLAEDPKWDGTYLGQKLPIDSYWYVVKLKPFDKIMQGHVTIMR